MREGSDVACKDRIGTRRRQGARQRRGRVADRPHSARTPGAPERPAVAQLIQIMREEMMLAKTRTGISDVAALDRAALA